MPPTAIDTGPACNNRCAVCPRPTASDAPARFSNLLATTFGDANSNEIESIGSVVIHGGEPTLHPELPAFLSRVRDTGGTLSLDTNARAFSVGARAVQLRQAGLSHAVVTLHGAREATHDFLTRTPGSFRQSVAGTLRLKAAGVRITVRLLVSRPSVLELANMATTALGLGAGEVRFSWARMEPRPGMPDLAAANAVARTDGKGPLRVDPNTPAGDRSGYDQGREWLVPRYVLAAESLTAAARAIQHVGRPVTVDGMPLCLAPPTVPAVPSSAACYLPTLSNIAGTDGKSDLFPPACDPCVARHRCHGIPAGYLARFGSGELSPILGSPATTATLPSE